MKTGEKRSRSSSAHDLPLIHPSQPPPKGDTASFERRSSKHDAFTFPSCMDHFFNTSHLTLVCKYPSSQQRLNAPRPPQSVLTTPSCAWPRKSGPRHRFHSHNHPWEALIVRVGADCTQRSHHNLPEDCWLNVQAVKTGNGICATLRVLSINHLSELSDTELLS